MTERSRLVVLAGLLTAMVVVLFWATLGSTNKHDSALHLGASFVDRCYWAVTIDTKLHGDTEAPCNSRTPPSLRHAKFFCAVDTLRGKPRPAPNNDLANC